MKNFTILTRCLRMNQCKRLSTLSPGLPLSPVPVGSAKTGKWSRVGVGIFGLGILSLDLYYYLYHYQVIKCLDEDEYQEFQVLDIDQVNHDTFKIKVETRILDLIKSQPIPCPAHVSVKDDSCQIARCYTPIQVDRESITLLVKRYSNGSVSRMLTNLKNGDKVWLRGLIPTFTYTPNRVDSLIMIAGGTGITPMYQLASSILKSDQNTQITLLYANKSKNDILLKSELDELASKFPKFTIKYTLEDYDSEWDQGKGRITSADLKDFANSKDSIAFIVCGPLGLIESIAGPRISNDDQGPLGGYLKELGFQDGQVLKL